MPISATTTGFIQLNDVDALYLSTEEELPPTVCPDLIPEGWGFILDSDGQEEVLDFQVEGEFVEMYLLRRIT